MQPHLESQLSTSLGFCWCPNSKEWKNVSLIPNKFKMYSNLFSASQRLIQIYANIFQYFSNVGIQQNLASFKTDFSKEALVGLKGSGNLPTRYARFGKPNWWIFCCPSTGWISVVFFGNVGWDFTMDFWWSFWGVDLGMVLIVFG